MRVAVVGAGIVGACTAWALARALRAFFTSMGINLMLVRMASARKTRVIPRHRERAVFFLTPRRNQAE